MTFREFADSLILSVHRRTGISDPSKLSEIVKPILRSFVAGSDSEEGAIGRNVAVGAVSESVAVVLLTNIAERRAA